MSNWRKGCLCGCLIEEECRYYEPPERVVHVIHHYPELREVEYVEAEVTIVREVEA